MPSSFDCSKCGASLPVPADLSVTVVRCRFCATDQLAPGLEARQRVAIDASENAQVGLFGSRTKGRRIPHDKAILTDIDLWAAGWRDEQVSRLTFGSIPIYHLFVDVRAESPWAGSRGELQSPGALCSCKTSPHFPMGSPCALSTP